MTASRRHGFSRARSMATAFGSMWRKFCFRRFAPATSWSWTISAATEARSCASSSAPQGQALLPAQILTRPEPDRAGLCQAQALPAKSCRPNGRSCLPRHRRGSPAFHARRMRKLLRKLRISRNLTSSRFSPTVSEWNPTSRLPFLMSWQNSGGDDVTAASR